jgi:hypothetical protein
MVVLARNSPKISDFDLLVLIILDSLALYFL